MVHSWISVSPNVQQDYVDYYISINLPNDVHPVEKEFLDEVVRLTIESATADYRRREQEYLDPIEMRVAEARNRSDELEKLAADLRGQMRKLSGRDDISGGTIGTAMTRMEEEKQRLELDTTATTRREAIEKTGRCAKRDPEQENRRRRDCRANYRRWSMRGSRRWN